jgi:transcriptional regulator with XRE-family HTH domain
MPEASPTNGDLGWAIRELRWERRLTIEELGFAAGVHPTYLSGIERGVRNPSWEKLCFLADALEIPVADMARRAESVARVQRGLERVLEDERSRYRPSPTNTTPNSGR